MKRFFFVILAFFASVITATVLASLFQTQFVVSDLNQIGASVEFGERLSMTGYDIAHLSRLYGIFIFLALAISFIAAALLYRAVKIKRTLIYVIAGCIAILVMLSLMKMTFFGVDLIAGARTGVGKAFQAIAGGVAGYLFARLTANPPSPESELT